MLPETLTTERLTLRGARLDDADWIATEIARPLVHQMLPTPPCPYRVSDAKDWLADATNLPEIYVAIADVPLGVIALESRTWGREVEVQRMRLTKALWLSDRRAQAWKQGSRG